MSIEKRLEINLFKNIIGYDIRCEKIRQFWKWPLTRPLTGCPCHRRRWHAYCSLKAKHEYGRYEIRNPSLVLTCQLKQKTRREGSKHSAGRPLCWYHVCDVKQTTRKYPCNIRGVGVGCWVPFLQMSHPYDPPTVTGFRFRVSEWSQWYFRTPSWIWISLLYNVSDLRKAKITREYHKVQQNRSFGNVHAGKGWF